MLIRCAVLALLLISTGCGRLTAPSERPYVVLVSIDGFRHDYAALHGAPNIDAIAQRGVRAQGMLPPYPSKTFPSHYSMVTGLYPEHHGIVGNDFYDPQRKEFYSMSGPSGHDGSWYDGTPIWNLAEQQGLHTAAFFWPASDFPVHGMAPSEYRVYDGSVPNEARIDQALEWLARPEPTRPHLITLYFSDVDSAGHANGPTAPETQAAVAAIDALIGKLRKGIAATGLPVNLIVVSDHGMLQVTEHVSIGVAREFQGFAISPTSGSMIMLYAEPETSPQQVDQILATLQSRAEQDAAGRDRPRYRVYRKGSAPDYLHYSGSPRIGDIIVMATAPIELGIDPVDLPSSPDVFGSPGAHGYDALKFQDMQSIFYAEGPQIRHTEPLYPFENVDVYPMIAAILGLELPSEGIDGDLDVLAPVLQDLPPVEPGVASSAGQPPQ